MLSHSYLKELIILLSWYQGRELCVSIENQAHIGPGKVVQCWGSLASSIGRALFLGQEMWVRVPHKTPNT